MQWVVSQSGFEKFVRDKYSTLGETKERMMASTVTARWRYVYTKFTQ